MTKDVGKPYKYYGDFSLKEKIISGINKEQRKRHLYDERLIMYWRDIVGEYANKMTPCRITFDGNDGLGRVRKILLCDTTDRQFSVEFIFYKKKIIDMLNLYFGDTKSIFSDVKLKVV